MTLAVDRERQATKQQPLIGFPDNNGLRLFALLHSESTAFNGVLAILSAVGVKRISTFSFLAATRGTLTDHVDTNLMSLIQVSDQNLHCLH